MTLNMDERADLMLQQGVQNQQRGNLQQAQAFFTEANKLAPRNLDILNALGGVLGQQGRFADAVQVFTVAANLAPDNPFLHYNKAISQQGAGQTEEALASYSKALEIQPDYPEALTNRGLLLHAVERAEEALADHDEAIALQPTYPRAHANRAMTLQALNRFEEALAAYDRSLELEPRQPETHANRGTLLVAMDRSDEALDAFKKAVALQPRFARAHQSEAYLRLLNGDFERGWPKFEWREGGTYSSRQNNYPQPTWRPTASAAGKRVMLYGSYMLSDTLQFARYAEMVATTGAIPIVVVPPRLKAFFAGLKGSPEIVGDTDPMPEFDLHRSLLSLPFVFQTTLDSIPKADAYLAAPPDLVAQWKERLGASGGKLRVGIAWNADPTVGRVGNVPIEEFEPLAANSKLRLIALQKPQDGSLPQHFDTLGDFDPDSADYADLAALIANLDLVITADGPLAHLAGAMGKPVWVALSKQADWRWLRDRSDSPWYPSMRLFRQKTRGDWKPVLAEIETALAALTA
jgi:tetratricopeptide (TPR) repeat protein